MSVWIDDVSLLILLFWVVVNEIDKLFLFIFLVVCFMCNNGFVNNWDNRKIVMIVSRNVMVLVIMNCFVNLLINFLIDFVLRNMYI